MRIAQTGLRRFHEHDDARGLNAHQMERIGWSNADHWVRVQGSYDLAQARLRERVA